MLNKSIVLVAAVTTAVAVYFGTEQLWAQSSGNSTNRKVFPTARQASPATRTSRSPQRFGIYNAWYRFTGSSPAVSREETKIRQKTGAVLQQYREAGDEEKRTAARDALNKLLDEHFEMRVQQREKQLDELKTRIAKLTAQLEQRRKAKGQIIDLRLKVLINEADGLGF